MQAFERELQLLKQLKHKNIVQYLGFERTDKALNIFMEYVAGGSISQLLARFNKLEEAVIRVYTRQLLTGLQYLHNNNIIHRG